MYFIKEMTGMKTIMNKYLLQGEKVMKDIKLIPKWKE